MTSHEVTLDSNVACTEGGETTNLSRLQTGNFFHSEKPTSPLCFLEEEHASRKAKLSGNSRNEKLLLAFSNQYARTGSIPQQIRLTKRATVPFRKNSRNYLWITAVSMLVLFVGEINSGKSSKIYELVKLYYSLRQTQSKLPALGGFLSLPIFLENGEKVGQYLVSCKDPIPGNGNSGGMVHLRIGEPQLPSRTVSILSDHLPNYNLEESPITMPQGYALKPCRFHFFRSSLLFGCSLVDEALAPHSPPRIVFFDEIGPFEARNDGFFEGEDVWASLRAMLRPAGDTPRDVVVMVVRTRLLPQVCQSVRFFGSFNLLSENLAALCHLFLHPNPKNHVLRTRAAEHNLILIFWTQDNQNEFSSYIIQLFCGQTSGVQRRC